MHRKVKDLIARARLALVAEKYLPKYALSLKHGEPMKLQPVHDRIIIKRIAPDEVSKGGILLPDPEKPDQGEVLAVGPGKRRDDGTVEPLTVKVGDRVILGKYSGTTVKVDGDELLVLREEDVFAVVGE